MFCNSSIISFWGTIFALELIFSSKSVTLYSKSLLRASRLLFWVKTVFTASGISEIVLIGISFDISFPISWRFPRNLSFCASVVLKFSSNSFLLKFKNSHCEFTSWSSLFKVVWAFFKSIISISLISIDDFKYSFSFLISSNSFKSSSFLINFSLKSSTSLFASSKDFLPVFNCSCSCLFK